MFSVISYNDVPCLLSAVSDRRGSIDSTRTCHVERKRKRGGGSAKRSRDLSKCNGTFARSEIRGSIVDCSYFGIYSRAKQKKKKKYRPSVLCQCPSPEQLSRRTFPQEALRIARIVTPASNVKLVAWAGEFLLADITLFRAHPFSCGGTIHLKWRASTSAAA